MIGSGKVILTTGDEKITIHEIYDTSQEVKKLAKLLMKLRNKGIITIEESIMISDLYETHIEILPSR